MGSLSRSQRPWMKSSLPRDGRADHSDRRKGDLSSLWGTAEVEKNKRSDRDRKRADQTQEDSLSSFP